ncbi:hypothetical protein [Sulfuracidifex metallicus]|uniref:hypothetical protein n=1 Tax=Sulfuracidifex metallicus TaxID=47303 RepID=UPI002274E218|nr:hypothetical protein [Sulfuracidifex metallicus]MCY0850088.1 hypothetical protein [Sulfuracidifex metallicus]
MNKIVGLALLSIFLGSVIVGVLPLATSAAITYPIMFGSTSESIIYTDPATNIIPYYNGILPGGIVNLLIKNTTNLDSLTALENFEKEVNITLYSQSGSMISTTTLYKVLSSAMPPYSSNITYYSPNIGAVLLVLNATESTTITEPYKEYVGEIPNAGTFIYALNGTKVSKVTSVNEIALPNIFDPAKIAIGDIIIINYTGVTYTFGVGAKNTIIGLENGLQEAGFMPPSSYTLFAGRQNGSIIVSDMSAYYATYYSPEHYDKLYLNLTYTPPYPETVYFKVVKNTTNTTFVKVYSQNGKLIYEPGPHGINNLTMYPLALTGLFKSIAFENVSQVTGYVGTVSTTPNSNSTTYASYPTDNFNSTPPTVNNISTVITVNDNATLLTTGYASGTENIFNATIYFSQVPVNTIYALNLTITPNYPYLYNKVNVTVEATASLTKSGSFYTMSFSTYAIEGKMKPGFGSSILVLQAVGYHSTGNYPLPITVNVTGIGYIALVDFGIWANYTVVTVGGYDQYNIPFSNVYPFRAVVIPPEFVYILNDSTVNSFSPFCLGQEYIAVKAIDDVLYTNATANPINSPTINGLYDMNVPPVYNSTGYHIYIYTNGKLVNSLSGLFTLPHQPSIKPISVTIYNSTTKTYETKTVNAITNTTPFYYLNLSMKLSPTSSIKVTPTYSQLEGINYVSGISVSIPPSKLANTKIVISYVDSDYAVYYYFNNTKAYELNYTITFNSSAVPSLLTPKAVQISSNYYNVSIKDGFYSGPLGSILKLSTTTVEPTVYLYYPGATQGIYVGNLTNITVTFANGTTVNIPLTNKNLTAIIPNLELSEDTSCSGIFTTSISIPGLESVLHVTGQQLNGSIVKISYMDNITGKTVTNSTLLYLETTLQKPVHNGTVDFVITTIKEVTITQVEVGRIPLYVVTQPEINITDPSYAQTSPTSITYLTTNQVNITSTDGYSVIITYNSTTGMTTANVYKLNATTGKYMYIMSQSVTGDALPTIPRFSVAVPYYIGSPLNIEFTPGSISNPYPNMSIVSNGITLNLGLPVQDFVAPQIRLQNGTVVNETVNSTVTVQVSDGIGDHFSAVVYITPASEAPLRISPSGVYVPHNPSLYNGTIANMSQTFVYSSPIKITSGNLVLNLNVTPVIKYPFFVYMEGEVHEGYNATTSSAVLGIATGFTYDPFFAPGVSLPVSLNLGGITGLAPGHTYTVYVQAYSYPGGPVMSEYPITLEFANVTYV